MERHLHSRDVYLSLERHQLDVELSDGHHAGVLGGGQRRDVGLLQVHAFGGSAPRPEWVVAVLGPDALLLDWARAAGGHLVRAAAAGVLLDRLRGGEEEGKLSRHSDVKSDDNTGVSWRRWE